MSTYFASATEAAAMIRRGEISAPELTDLLLARIDALNPELNAVVELRRDAAPRAGGPLHGVPMTVKEAFNVAGLHTTWGIPAARDHVADTDATIVRRLEQAGATIVGKTNVPAMLADFGQTANELYGRTRNPWDTALTPGGSSGGAAAAVAAGMTFLEYGSDLVGSIRIPAAFCGVYGLKPSTGIVPLSGFQPPGPPAPPSDMTYLSSIGPLARSAADLRTALTVTAGPEGPAANAYSWSLAPPRHTRLSDFRVGVVLDHERAPVSGAVAGPLSDTVDALVRAGATVVEGWPEGVDPVRSHESFGFHVGAFFAFLEPGGELAEGFVEHETRRMAARAAWQRYFADIDVFLCPVNFTTAFPHDGRPFEERTVGGRSYQDQSFWISHASLAGLPALSAPIGGAPPVGAQIVGPLYEDDTAITFAELLAAEIGGFQAPYSLRAGVTSEGAVPSTW